MNAETLSPLAEALAGRRAFLKTAEAARIAVMDVRTLRKGIEEGVIPAVRIGNTIRIPAAPFLALCGLTIDRSQTNEAAAVPTGDRSQTSPHQELHVLDQESTRDHRPAA